MQKLALMLILAASLPAAADPPKVIHIFVALCDNAAQGIAPVPAKIGNGDDPNHNLYWGCDDGLRTHFKQRKTWRLVETRANPKPDVLERLVFKHATHDAWLVADAYRGAAIKRSLEDFLAAAAGRTAETIELPRANQPVSLHLAGSASFLAFIGHNGLMDFTLPFPSTMRSGASVPAVVLCCKSQDYFEQGLRLAGAQPLLLTTQFMYPGSFILHAALDGWLAGQPPTALRELAATAYARNQKISVKAARGVFAAPATR